MQIGIRTAITAIVAMSAWCGLADSTVQAQLPDLSLVGDDGSVTAQPEVEFVLQRNAKQQDQAVLSVTLIIPPGSHVYSTSLGFSGRTQIEITDTRGLKPLDPDFKPDHPPKSSYEPLFDKTIEKFTDRVTWTRRFQIESGVDPQTLSLSGEIVYQICNADNCTRYSEKFQVALTEPPPELSSNQPAAKNSPAPFQYEIRPTRGSGERATPDHIRFTFALSPEDAKPGQSVTLSITAKLDEGYHVFAQTQNPKNYGKPTVIDDSQSTGLKALGESFQPDRSPKMEDPLGEGKQQHTFYKQVTWTRKYEVTETPFGVGGELKYQICDEHRCYAPNGVDFVLGTTTGQASSVPATTGAPPVIVVEDTESAGLGLYLLYAFLGGLILNIMPCVLPVLAIKVMSFVQQAGESRGRILALNAVYAVGVISVFIALASLAIFPQILGEALGWGGLFQRPEFNLIMAAIVFAMGLSLLGVFEIPVPGMVGSGGQREGLLGAFLTGVLATLLATPCSGPFLGVTLAWSVRQEVAVTFLVWGTMGLGMASPYLLFGLFPGAIKWLPKPGNWMVRLKEFAGFVLMGTVIFIINFTQQDHIVPLLIMLLGISLALWMIGNMYDANAKIQRKWTVRLSALVLGGLICGFGYSMSRTDHEANRLPWEPFSDARLNELLAERRTVLIDFTADWCLTCKTVEKFALNTEETLDLVEKHNVVPLYADYTHESPEIKTWLDKFDSKSVPLTVIFPSHQPDRPILIRDFYTQSKLLENLKLAVAPGPSADQQALRRAAARE